MKFDYPEREKLRKLKLDNFNSSVNGIKDKGIFGLPFDKENAELIIIPVPWDVTSSYGCGSSNAPSAMLEASWQIDLYSENYPGIFRKGIAMDDFPFNIKSKNDELRKLSEKIIHELDSDNLENVSNHFKNEYLLIKNEFLTISDRLKEKSLQLISEGRIAAALGGDHSISPGLINALSQSNDEFTILQFDAHADLRNCYEGFEYSHASAMFNILKNGKVNKLVQIGIRDYCEEEVLFIKKHPGRIKTFTDKYLKDCLFNGQAWKSICQKIIEQASEKVYISFDIDGLEPSLCPNTGAPVPGGLSFEQVTFLFNELYKSGKKIIGFDLCEVNASESNDWDANVGMRILYELSCLTLASNYK